MIKKIGVLLFLIFLPGFSSAMEEPDGSPSFMKILTHKDLLDSKTFYEVHFFWTTGVQFQDCSLTAKSTQVPIGGTEIYEKFQIYLTHFLGEPLPLLVRFITDDLTLHTNPWLLSLHENYPKRFLISSVIEVERQIRLRFPEFERTISIVFENAQKGNPALASDAYRLIGMKSHDRFPSSALETMPEYLQLSYTDIDNFTNGLEKNPEAFLRALFTTPPPFKILRKITSNDLVSFKFKQPVASDDWDAQFCCDVLKKWSDANSLHFFSYCPRRYVSVVNSKENEESVAQIKKLATDLSFFTALIVKYTGPAFLSEFETYFSSSLEYPSICAMSWSLLSFLQGNGVSLPSPDIQGSPPELVDVFLSYYTTLECALVAKKLGTDHPSYLFLRGHIQEFNPFFSSQYKKNLKKYVTLKSSDSGKKTPEEVLHKYFETLIEKNPYLLPGVTLPLEAFRSNTYLKLQDFLLRSFNISFELKESDLLAFYRSY